MDNDLIFLKRVLHIDGDYNDIKIKALKDAAEASLLPTIGLTSDNITASRKEFIDLKQMYIAEYVRGLYFQIDNEKVLEVLRCQLETMLLTNENGEN